MAAWPLEFCGEMEFYVFDCPGIIDQENRDTAGHDRNVMGKGAIMKGKQKNGEMGTQEYAPDFTLTTVKGTQLSLSELLRDRCAILLVFLRHLG